MLNIQELIHTNSSKEYLNESSTSLVQEFISLFEKILTRNEYPDVKNFLEIINENKFMRDCFQLAICIGKHDIDSCLKQIAFNKSEPGLEWDEARERNEQYNNLLKRIFFLIIDMKKASTKEIKRFLGMFLKEKNLRIVNSSYKQFEEKEDNKNFIRIDTDSESDPETLPKKARNSNTKSPVNEPTNSQNSEPTTAQLSAYIRSKYEPHSCINIEHLINLEKEISPQSSTNSFIEFILENKFCFEQFGITANLFNKEMDNVVKSRKLNNSKRMSIAENIKQISDVLKTSSDSNDRMVHVKQIIEQFYSVSHFEDLGIGEFEHVADLISEKNMKPSNIVCIDSLLEHSDLIKLTSRSQLSLSDRSLIRKKLLECPLLENISDYLNLNVNLNHGDIKLLIADLNSECTDMPINVLEISPGVLLKLTNKTDVSILKESIEKGDYVNSCGHLVSLIAFKYRVSTPCSLLANEIESSLAIYLEKCQVRKESFFFCVFF